jgi:hypothetical protein
VKRVNSIERQYKKEFEEYLDVKEKKEGFEKYKTKKDNWDNFNIKGANSHSKKGLELRLSPQKDDKFVCTVVKQQMKHEELLSEFNEEDKEAFALSRELYNSLDLVLLDNI